MKEKDRRVAIILDKKFPEDKLFKLAESMQVWIVETPSSKKSAEVFWKKRTGNEGDVSEGSVTIFEAYSDMEESILGDILFTVYEHHPKWSEVHIFGSPLTDHLKNIISEFGFSLFEETGEKGFVAKRET